MLPISDLHFAFCGIATVAATLGYACARRAVLALPSKPDVEAVHSGERSLKRKLDDADEHGPDTEDHSRPMKRNRTPPIDDDEWEIIPAPPSYEQAAGLQEPLHDKSTPGAHTVEQSAREPSPPAYETLPQKATEERCPSPPRPITPPPSKVKSAHAFSAFSGSTSPFASYSSPSGTSPFAISGQTVRTVPAWRHNNEIGSDVFGRTGPANALAPSPNDAPTSAISTTAVPTETPSLPKSFTHLTGEEEEQVTAELKGVKLFVKRGRKEFTDGMYGHIKILAQKFGDDKSHSRTRLLFRRDPLGQVSMNVGLNPTVSTDGTEPKEDVVVYAIKPGRAQKADFESFAKTLCDHKVLKSRAVASPTAPASGAGAASL